MKRGPEMPDSQRKKLVGEHLRNADKLLKTGEYDQALAEVERGLELEPGNFYAQAYRERITALREKHSGPGNRAVHPDASGTPRGGLGSAPPPPPPSGAPATEPAPDAEARLGESAGKAPAEGEAAEETIGTPDAGTGTAGRDIEALRRQLDRERASQEDEARRHAEDLARQAIESELREREAADQMLNAERQAIADALSAAPADALAIVLKESEESFWRLISAGDLDGAFRELASIGIIDPGNAGIGEMTRRLDDATLTALQPAPADSRSAPREVPLQWYARLLRSAWGEGKPNGAQTGAITEAKQRFGVTVEEEKELLSGIRREIVSAAVAEAYREGEPDAEAAAFLNTLAAELSVTDLDALKASARR